MRVLVVGGSGFIGRSVVQRLVGRHDVLGLTRDTSRLPNNVVPLIGDLTAPLDTRRWPSRLDAIVHLAQSTRHRDFPAAADDLFVVNVAATARLLELARSHGVSRFVLASSGSAHDAQLAVASGDVRTAPPSFFAATKLASEALLWPYAGYFQACVLRVFFPYGPGQTDRLVPDLIERVRRGTHVVLTNGEGMQMSPTFVDDIADVFVAALEDGWTGRLDVAAPGVTSLKAIAEEIGRQLRTAPLFEYRDGPTAPPLLPDLKRLGQRYDLSRFRSFTDGLAATLRQGT